MCLDELKQKSKQLRRESFEMVMRAKKGHLGGSFSCTEMLVVLYYGGILSFNPADPCWSERDLFALSKGHSLNTLQVLLSDLGFFPKSEIDRFFEDGSILGGHVDTLCPGIEVKGGSLGHGLGVATGMALGLKIDKKDQRVFVILGDGECQEGSIWEASMFASHHNLDNLIVLLDRNMIGSEDFTENTCKLEPLDAKWESFGWEVKNVDGHSIPDLLDALQGCKERTCGKPLVLICHTIKGKGMSWCENTPQSHHTLPQGEDIEKTIQELS